MEYDGEEEDHRKPRRTFYVSTVLRWCRGDMNYTTVHKKEGQKQISIAAKPSQTNVFIHIQLGTVQYIT